MLIGEISNKTGLTKDTIRFYEKQGLIKADRSQSLYNNYKNYTDDVLNRLIMIKRIKNFGFTLKETSDLLDLIELNQATCGTIKKQVDEKINLINQKILELIELKKTMSYLITDCCQPTPKEINCPSLSILTN